MLNERTITILEENDIKVYDREEQDGEFYREIEFYSPEDEDVIETVWYDGTDEGFIEAFKRLAEDFDADEHAEMWINNRGSVRGVPDSIRDLIDDAEAIKKILLDVSEELQNIKHNTKQFKVVIETAVYIEAEDEEQAAELAMEAIRSGIYESAIESYDYINADTEESEED